MNTFSKLAAAVVLAALSFGVVAQNISPPKERFLNRSELDDGNPIDGIFSRRLYTDTVFIAMVRMEAGVASAEHNHPDEQTMLFHTGRSRAFVGDREYVVGPGDILIIPAYIPHYVEAIEDSTWTEVHGPGFNNSAKWVMSGN